MKKCTFWLLMALSLSAFGWCNNVHHYKVTFSNGRSVVMTTKSYSRNWDYDGWSHEHGFRGLYFYYNDDKYYDINMAAIWDAYVEKRVLDTRENTRLYDGYIAFDMAAEVKEVDV